MQRVRVLAGQVVPSVTSASCGAGKRKFTVIDHSTGEEVQVETEGEVITAAELSRALSRDRRETAAPRRTRVIRFIGAPFAEGQNLIGTEVGPQAMRDAGFQGMVERLGWSFLDNGDRTYEGYDSRVKDHHVATFQRWMRSCPRSMETYEQFSKQIIRSPDSVHVAKEITGNPYHTIKNCDVIAKGCKAVHDEVLDASRQGHFALTIGGDHSLGVATIGALLQTYPDLAVVWVDAHADANTPDTSLSNHYHGMPAAHVLGWFKEPVPGFEWLKTMLDDRRLAYIGLRDIDPEEGQMLQASGVHAYTMNAVDRLGISQVVQMALDRIDPYHTRPIHLTFDIDSIDPVFAPGTGTLARGGLTYRESHYICEELAATNRLVGMDLVEVNPLVDQLPIGMHGDDPDMLPTTSTVHLAMELALSSLGKNIMNHYPQAGDHIPHILRGHEHRAGSAETQARGRAAGEADSDHSRDRGGVEAHVEAAGCPR